MTATNRRVVIETRDLRRTYGEGESTVHALKGIDIRVHEGEYVAITGPSGSGKSTLLSLLGCLDIPSSGTYLLDGTDVSTLTVDEQADIRNIKIGFVFQSFNLMKQFTAIENIELPMLYADVHDAERRSRAMEALEKVDLANRADHLPNELSGGQCQRVAVARALVMRPAIVLADEPTGNLDSEVGHSILELFDDLHRDGVTLVVITHDDYVAERAERRIEIFDGLVKNDTSLAAR